MTEFHFNCPKCSQVLEATGDLRGQVLDCPSCKNPIQVPKAQLKIVKPGTASYQEPTHREVEVSTTTDDLLSCPKCNEPISRIAGICPLCWAKIEPQEKPSIAIKTGVGIGVTALALLTPVYAALGGLGAAMEAGGSFVARKALMARNRKLGAIDVIPYNAKDEIPGYVTVTRDSFIQLVSTLGIPVEYLTVPRSAVVDAAITGRKKVWGGVRITITVTTNTATKKPFTVIYSMHAAEKLAEVALIKLRYYARGK